MEFTYNYEKHNKSSMYPFWKKILGFISRYFFKVEIKGKENIPDGSFLLCANHISHIDAFLIAGTDKLPPIHNMAMSELFKKPLQRRFLLSMNCFPVYRKSEHSKKAIEYAVKLLKEGSCVGIYPEGEINKLPPYRPTQARSGASIIALKADRPVVACAIYCDGKIKPFKKITISFSKPIEPENIRQAYEKNGSFREASNYIFNNTLKLWEASANGEHF